MQTKSSGVASANGLVVLAVIVVVGLLTGAGFYRWQRGRMDARLAAELAAAPSSPEERAALWLRLSGGPQIHHRLAVVGRFTPELPWLVTHAVTQPEGGAPVLWGVACASLSQDFARLEGLRVVVELPRPVALGNATLEGESAARVQIYTPEASPDPSLRLRELALHLLEGIPKALERDVPGASLELRVASE